MALTNPRLDYPLLPKFEPQQEFPTAEDLNSIVEELIRLREDLKKTQTELAEIKETSEYQTWCSQGMPGLIKPQESPAVFRCGMAVKIVSATGINADSWNHKGGLVLGDVGAVTGYSSLSGNIRYEVNGFLVDPCDLQEVTEAPWNPKGAQVKLLRSREKKYNVGPIDGVVSGIRVSSSGETQWWVTSTCAKPNGIWFDACDLKVVPTK